MEHPVLLSQVYGYHRAMRAGLAPPRATAATRSVLETTPIGRCQSTWGTTSKLASNWLQAVKDRLLPVAKANAMPHLGRGVKHSGSWTKPLMTSSEIARFPGSPEE